MTNALLALMESGLVLVEGLAEAVHDGIASLRCDVQVAAKDRRAARAKASRLSKLEREQERATKDFRKSLDQGS